MDLELKRDPYVFIDWFHPGLKKHQGLLNDFDNWINAAYDVVNNVDIITLKIRLDKMPDQIA